MKKAKITYVKINKRGIEKLFKAPGISDFCYSKARQVASTADRIAHSGNNTIVPESYTLSSGTGGSKLTNNKFTKKGMSKLKNNAERVRRNLLPDFRPFRMTKGHRAGALAITNTLHGYLNRNALLKALGECRDI